MNKIKEMYSIFIFYGCQYESANLPFLDWIYNQENSKHIGITEKVRLDYQ